VVEILQQRGLLNPESNSINFNDFILELSSHQIALSLAGAGEFCHRDIEALGVGVCLLRPALTQQFDSPLIPNVHYIHVDTDTEQDSPETAAARIEERYWWVTRQPELLRRVAQKGAEWFDQNVRTPESLELTARILGLGNQK
jgi:hypothetical protein